MIIVLIIGLLLSIYSPSLGMLYLIPALAKITFFNAKKNNTFFAVWLLTLLTANIFKVIDSLSCFQLVIGVGLTIYLLQKELNKPRLLDKALVISASISSLVAIVKFYFYSELIKSNLELSIKTTLDLLKSKYPVSSAEFIQINEFMKFSKVLYLNYNYSFAIFTAIIATWIGLLILSRKIAIDLKFDRYYTPNVITYLMIFGLIALIFPQTKYPAENLLIVCLGFFLIQGISVAWFYYGKLIRSSIVLIILFSLSLIMNPYLLLMLALVGIVDTWFDLRKLNKLEETHENNIN